MPESMLGGFFIGVTMVGDDQSVVTVDAGGGAVHGESRVAGSLSLAYSFAATVTGSTTVSANSGVASDIGTGTIATRTTVTADPPILSVLSGHVAARTSLTVQAVVKYKLSGSVATRTSFSVRLNEMVALVGRTVACKTVVTANLVRPVALPSATTIQCSSAVTGNLSQHILRAPAIHTRTTVTGLANLLNQPSGHVVTRTTVTATRTLASYTLTPGAITLGTVVTGRTHSFPTDFQDVLIQTRTVVHGSASNSPRIGAGSTSTIQGRTVLAALMTTIVAVRGTVATRTTVTARALRYGFGADLSLRTITHGRLGIQTGINSWKGQNITGKTVVVGAAPNTGFAGTPRGKTAFTRAVLGKTSGVAGVATCRTQFHTHYPIRGHIPAFEGPFGSVNLTDVPHGDLGIAVDITCSTAPTADITVERQRVMVVFGNAAVSVDRTLVVHGNATAGTGIRQVGTPVEPQESLNRQVTYYV